VAQNFWHVRNCSLFERLNTDQLALLESQSRTRQFLKGSTVYLPHDSADAVFLLVVGRIRLGTATPDGKYAALGYIEPGELFGELSLLDATQREERAEAISDSTVVMLPSATISRLMDESAALAISVTKLIGFRRKRVERRLKSLLFRSNRHRLVYLLMDLSEQYGRSDGLRVHLDIKLSHQDLANLIGATRETVTVTLGELQQQRLLTLQRQKIILLDLPRLAQELNNIAPTTRASDPAHDDLPGRLGPRRQSSIKQ
jgi:CRP/FNR family transcriptional regulator, cyclic AMP receptor protein